jgi:hypothetical protein
MVNLYYVKLIMELEDGHHSRLLAFFGGAGASCIRLNVLEKQRNAQIPGDSSLQRRGRCSRCANFAFHQIAKEMRYGERPEVSH